MRDLRRNPVSEAMTALLPDLFRLNSLVLASGDRLVAGLGLTSARWQVLGAIEAAGAPQPVAWLARDLGGARQNVHRIVNDLEREGLVAFEVNPRHRRAQLVVLTARGRQAFDAAMALQAPWVNELSKGLTRDEVETTHRVIRGLRERLMPLGEGQGSDTLGAG